MCAAEAAGSVVSHNFYARRSAARTNTHTRRVIVRVSGGGSGKRASERAHTSAGDPALVARTAWSAHIIGSGGGGFSRFLASKAHPGGGDGVLAARGARGSTTLHPAVHHTTHVCPRDEPLCRTDGAAAVVEWTARALNAGLTGGGEG